MTNAAPSLQRREEVKPLLHKADHISGGALYAFKQQVARKAVRHYNIRGGKNIAALHVAHEVKVLIRLKQGYTSWVSSLPFSLSVPTFAGAMRGFST